MADIINLKRMRKLKQRQIKSQQAAETRARHGRTKAQKLQDAKTTAEAQRRLDLLKIDPDPDPNLDTTN